MATAMFSRQLSQKLRKSLKFVQNTLTVRDDCMSISKDNTPSTEMCTMVRNRWPTSQENNRTSTFQRHVRGKQDILHFISGRSYVAHTTQRCWKCSRNINIQTEQFFCECGIIQPPNEERNYFEVMEIDTTFDVNMRELTTKFRELQTLLHPDKFTQKSEVC